MGGARLRSFGMAWRSRRTVCPPRDRVLDSQLSLATPRAIVVDCGAIWVLHSHDTLEQPFVVLLRAIGIFHPGSFVTGLRVMDPVAIVEDVAHLAAAGRAGWT